MSEQQSKRIEIEDVSRVDSLLGFIGDLSKREPPMALRERLRVLAGERLSHYPRHVERKRLTWLKPVVASACFVAAGLATGLAVHFFERSHIRNSGTAKLISSVPSQETMIHSVAVVRPSADKLPKSHHLRPSLVELPSTRQMTLRLPYSNSAIATGTGTTIRITMSQSELVSLGFPINETVQDRRIVAELTLGDDGLPRAISLPLPLEVLKEKK
jgi:hypothetical protein